MLQYIYIFFVSFGAYALGNSCFLLFSLFSGLWEGIPEYLYISSLIQSIVGGILSYSVYFMDSILFYPILSCSICFITF